MGYKGEQFCSNTPGIAKVGAALAYDAKQAGQALGSIANAIGGAVGEAATAIGSSIGTAATFVSNAVRDGASSNSKSNTSAWDDSNTSNLENAWAENMSNGSGQNISTDNPIHTCNYNATVANNASSNICGNFAESSTVAGNTNGGGFTTNQNNSIFDNNPYKSGSDDNQYSFACNNYSGVDRSGSGNKKPNGDGKTAVGIIALTAAEDLAVGTAASTTAIVTLPIIVSEDTRQHPAANCTTSRGTQYTEPARPPDPNNDFYNLLTRLSTGSAFGVSVFMIIEIVRSCTEQKKEVPNRPNTSIPVMKCKVIL